MTDPASTPASHQKCCQQCGVDISLLAAHDCSARNEPLQASAADSRQLDRLYAIMVGAVSTAVTAVPVWMLVYTFLRPAKPPTEYINDVDRGIVSFLLLLTLAWLWAPPIARILRKDSPSSAYRIFWRTQIVMLSAGFAIALGVFVLGWIVFGSMIGP